MAAAELIGVAWRGEESSAGVPRGVVGKQELACGPPRRRAALNCAGGREAEREGGGRHRLDLFAISEKFRGPTIKQK